MNAPLRKYLSALPYGKRGEFAAKCGTTLKYLHRIASGERSCSEALAVTMERVSNGSLKCEDLCPNVDWGYIRGTSRKHRREQRRHA